jgi:hypothetical protein
MKISSSILILSRACKHSNTKSRLNSLILLNKPQATRPKVPALTLSYISSLYWPTLYRRKNSWKVFHQRKKRKEKITISSNDPSSDQRPIQWGWKKLHASTPIVFFSLPRLMHSTSTSYPAQTQRLHQIISTTCCTSEGTFCDWWGSQQTFVIASVWPHDDEDPRQLSFSSLRAAFFLKR